MPRAVPDLVRAAVLPEGAVSYNTANIRRYEQHCADQGRPVRRPLGLREQAAKLRKRAAEDLALASELEEAADIAGEPT